MGPFARSAADAAVVLDAIRGRDTADPSSFTADMEDPFSIDVQSLTVGVLSNTPTLVSLNFEGSSFTADLHDPISIDVQSLTVGVLSNTPILVCLNFRFTASAWESGLHNVTRSLFVSFGGRPDDVMQCNPASYMAQMSRPIVGTQNRIGSSLIWCMLCRPPHLCFA